MSEVTEASVRDAWERQLFPATALAVLGINLVFRGVPSDAGGPDYQDAMWSDRSGRLVRGDIEFHVRSSDWFRHGHHLNPLYNSVGLHVVWKDDCPTVRQDGALVLTLELCRLTGKVDAVPLRLDGLEDQCIDAYLRHSPTELAAAIDEAGRARFGLRAALFRAEVDAVGPEQTVYAALLESLGYASNRQSFRLLADAVPFAWLMSVPPRERAATLLDAAGLGPPAAIDPPARLLREAWRLVRIRPGNHPAARISACAILLNHLGNRPVDRLLNCLRDSDRPTRLREQLRVSAVGGAIGPGRADEIAASVVLPFLHAVDSRCGARELYDKAPSPPSTRWTRLMVERCATAGCSLSVKSACRHQGLHHLYHEHCRLEHRSGCPVCG